MQFRWRSALAQMLSCCLALLGGVERLRADSRACEGVRLVVDATLDQVWADAAAQLQTRLHTFGADADCTVVQLLGAPGHMHVQVTLGDGRSVTRPAETPEVLLPTVEALLTPLPEQPSQMPVAPAAPPPSPPLPAMPPEPRLLPPPMVVLEFGVAPSLHFAGTPRYLGYGLAAHVDVLVDSWVLGIWSRWDFQDRFVDDDPIPPDFDMSSFLLGAFAGYRFSVRGWAVDAVAGPNLVIENQEARSTHGVGEVGGAFSDMTISAALRLLGPRHRWPHPTFFALLAAELNPRRVTHTVQRDPELPPLPAWGGTLALGAAWSAR
ncbi:MAG: hypothetical protein QM778_30220 [Myxococcales bacterium]